MNPVQTVFLNRIQLAAERVTRVYRPREKRAHIRFIRVDNQQVLQIRKHLTFWSGLVRLYIEGRWTMYIINISEAKAHLSALIKKVIAGNEVIIGKAGKPVARLVRYERSEEPRSPGALRGKIRIADDFDELPDDIARVFGMRDE